MTEYFETGSKKRRGRPPGSRTGKSLALIKAMYEAAEASQPITGRGIGYKLFSKGLIPSMGRSEMQRVYRLLKEAREEGTIPWEWIVDETRGVERVATWDNPEEFAKQMTRSYRLDFWKQQPVRVEVWSEKGTVRGVLAPTLDRYGVGFNPVHGFNSSTNTYAAAQSDNSQELVILYVGDYDPSGMNMSEHDLPKRLPEYGGHHIKLRRIALTLEHVEGLLSFPASDKRKDPRYKWFVANYGDRCWELDAMDPNVLRDLVEAEIKKQITDTEAWERCEVVYEAQFESIKNNVEEWFKPRSKGAQWHPSTAAMSAVKSQ